MAHDIWDGVCRGREGCMEMKEDLFNSRYTSL